MKTKKQQELINSFISAIGNEAGPLYFELAKYLSELGYNPKKEGQRISFKHDKHNKQIAKMGMTRGKSPCPVFMLRFSACKDYSQRFIDIVKEAVIKSSGDARCLTGECDYCAGEPSTHVYFDGDKSRCGSHALEIPGITADDMQEIKKLIKEAHVYLMKHQAGIII